MTVGSISHVAVLLKHAPQRVTIDALSGEVTVDPRDVGLSSADEAALETALVLGSEVTVITAGPPEAIEALQAAAAVGASSLVYIPASAEASSRTVAEALASACADADLVLCGDYSADRGSGTVPAFVAAHLGIAQALGVVAVTPEASAEGFTGVLVVERRLDRGRREQLRLAGRAVVSVEGSVARLRRASLHGLLAAKTATIDVHPIGGAAVAEAGATSFLPHRPRVQLRPTPDPLADPLDRVRQVTDATSTRNPPRTVTADPAEAAAIIMESLGEWGYLDETEVGAS